MSRLHKWKLGERPKPLVLRGARQVGKSSLVRAFSATYDHFIELNLETRTGLSLFEGMPNAEDLVKRLLLQHSISVKKGESALLFIDEIQQDPSAIQYLRYLYEDQDLVHVIAAGSLLEFALGEVQSMPVGRVEYLSVHPLTFSEYLTWIGNEELAKHLDTIPAPSYAHPVLSEKYRDFALYGGMPEIVKKLRTGAGIEELQNAYSSIWDSYKIDLERHAKSNAQRSLIRHLLQTAPFEHDRFSYANFGGSTYKSREVKEAFQMLEMAKCIFIIEPTSNIERPLTPNTRARPRLQFLDVGLLNYATGLHKEVTRLTDISSSYKGRLALQVVTQELIASSDSFAFKPNFWIRENKNANAEVDLLYVLGTKVYGLEVKSGPKGRLRSLHQFVQRSGSSIGIRALENTVSIESAKTTEGYSFQLLNIPLYGISKLKSYLKWAMASQRPT